MPKGPQNLRGCSKSTSAFPQLCLTPDPIASALVCSECGVGTEEINCPTQAKKNGLN